MNETIATIHARTSDSYYDTTRTLGKDTIRALVQDASEAPSAFNIQHWRFIAVTDSECKAALMAAAYGQSKVGEAAVTFIVLGDLNGHAKLPEILERSVEAKVLTSAVADGWVGAANGMYGDPALARDEAIRSASFAAMTMMIAAKAKGLSTGPMIGFDPAKVAEIFGIGSRYVPVLLLTVGYPGDGNSPRKPRLAVDEILTFNAAPMG